MKKILCLLGAVALVFTSCSKDDNDSSDPASSVLVKKIITIDANGNSSSESYLYNGNKIVSMTEDDGSVTNYTYTGDLITKIEEFDMNGTLNLTTNYNYINGKLDNSVDKHPAESYYYKTKYIHNVDGTISYNQFKGVAKTGVEEEYGAAGKCTFKDGNLLKNEYSFNGDENLIEYEYDAKNHPCRNIMGINLLLNIDPANSYVNNLIAKIKTPGSATLYTYKYDANNYPVELTVSNFDTESVVRKTQFFY